MKHRILIVDDQPYNLEILQEDLEDEGYETASALNGAIAWEILQADTNFSVILLDRMMPIMDGMQLIEKIKNEGNAHLARIPIIMQTAAAEKAQVAEGITAGVYYYLTKPFDKMVMLSLVRAAVNDYGEQSKLRSELEKHKSNISLATECQYEISTIEESNYLSAVLANYFPDPNRVILGISELLTNSIEHGKLGITYEEKTKLRKENAWLDEVSRRQNMPENLTKKVSVSIKKTENNIILNIKDFGAGFDWKKYLEIDPERATHTHGRGIALSKMMSFDELEYIGNGNEVTCKIKLT